MPELNNIGDLRPADMPQVPRTEGTSDTSFNDLLMDEMRQVDRLQQEADHAIKGLARGDDVNPAEVMSAVRKADIAFGMLMEVRNKVVDAYQEVMRMRT